MKLEDRLAILDDEASRTTLLMLHEQHKHQAFRIGCVLLPQLHRLLARRRLDWDHIEPRLRGQPLSVDAESGLFLCFFLIATRARNIIELGTSVGVSTIYLALAARHNGGRVITAELCAEKSAQARKHVHLAGLSQWVEFRTGDAREVLRDVDGPIDFFHNDAYPRVALPVLQMLTPRMREGAVTMCGNAALFPADHAEYVAWVRDPQNGFVSGRFSMQLGGETSIRSKVTGEGEQTRA